VWPERPTSPPECGTSVVSGANRASSGHWWRMASKLNPPNPSTEPAALPPAGLLVVTIDRLPAWMLAAYGATWVSTPALDSLAARGVVFDRMIATSPAPDHTLHDLVGQLFAATGGWPAAGVTDDPVVAAGMVVATAGGPAASVRLVEAAAKTEVEENDAETNIARLVDAAIDVIAARQHRLVWCHIGSLAVAWDAPERYRDRYIDPEDPPPPSGARVPGFAVDADTDPDRVVGMRQVFAGQVKHLFVEQMFVGGLTPNTCSGKLTNTRSLR